MAGLFAWEKKEQRSATSSLDETVYTRVIGVRMDDVDDDEDAVQAYVFSLYGIKHGATLGTKNAWCNNVTAKSFAGSPFCWEYTATFSSKIEMDEDDPVDDPVEIEWDEEDIDVPVLKDRNGDAVLNSAGDFPDPLPVGQDSIMVATITFKTTADANTLTTFRKSINTDAFVIEGKTVNAKHARIRKIKLGKRKWRGDNPYRDGTIELAILDNDEDDWEIRWLDAGYRYLDSTTGKLKKATTEGDDSDPVQPVLLDGSGNRLASPSPSTAVFNETPWYRLKTFVGNIPGCEAPV